MTSTPHALTKFEIQAYYQNEPRFEGVFSLPNTIRSHELRSKELGSAVKNGAYVINLDEYHDIGTHWVALYVNNKTVIGFPDNTSFGLGSRRKNIITNIFRI